MGKTKIAVQTLNTEYLNTHFEGQVSKDNPDKNIKDLQISIVDGKLQIKWSDSESSHWSKNYFVKCKNQIPATAYSDVVIESTELKNAHKDIAFIDSKINEDTLYCYRIFTEFDNSAELYSGFKNIFFVYVYNEDAESNSDIEIGDRVIAATMILQDANHRFVTDTQILDWNNKADQATTYTKDEVNSIINDIKSNAVTESSNGLMTPDMLSKLNGLKNYVHPDSHPASMISGLSNVATSGNYNDLINKPVIPVVSQVGQTGDYNDLTNKPTIPVISTVGKTGSYNDLTDRPVFSNVAFSGDYNDLLNKPDNTSGSVDESTLATVAKTGEYSDLLNKPTFSAVATSGNYNDLSNRPTIPTLPVLADVATSGNYNDLTNTPTIPAISTVGKTGKYDDLLNKPTLKSVATTGNYNDLINKPTIPDISTMTISYDKVTGKPSLAKIATTGNYDDLTNKPVLKPIATSGDFNDLINVPDSMSKKLARVATSGDYLDLINAPEYAAVAATGSYSDLTNKPTIPQIIARGSSRYSGSTGVTITIPVQSSISYMVMLTNTENPNGSLGEVYIHKTTGSFKVYNSGSAKTSFDYFVI